MSEKENGRKNEKKDVASYYDGVAENYHRQYEFGDLETAEKYPQNYFRLQILIERMKNSGCGKIYEVGTGEGTPLASLHELGFDVWGCDISGKMVEMTRERFRSAGIDENRVLIGDIEKIDTIQSQVEAGPFDAVIAFGVMPHVADDLLALGNMKKLLKPGGKAFVEFRNKLFSLFTLNRYTKEFILDDLLAGVSSEMKAEVEADLDKRLALDQPPPRKDSGAGYDTIRAKFHNPFEVPELLKSAGFTPPEFHWYHFHAAPPMLEPRNRTLFWKEAAKMEYSNSWRGHFLCSAFFVETEVSR